MGALHTLALNRGGGGGRLIIHHGLMIHTIRHAAISMQRKRGTGTRTRVLCTVLVLVHNLWAGLSYNCACAIVLAVTTRDTILICDIIVRIISLLQHR